jgi:hypothetical protein
MAIINNVFNAGLDGGTFICTGENGQALTYVKVFKGLRVVTPAVELISILDNNGINVTSSVLVDNILTNISGSQLFAGTIIKPTGSYNFTGFTFSGQGYQDQVVLYLTGSNN